MSDLDPAERQEIARLAARDARGIFLPPRVLGDLIGRLTDALDQDRTEQQREQTRRELVDGLAAQLATLREQQGDPEP